MFVITNKVENGRACWQIRLDLLIVEDKLRQSLVFLMDEQGKDFGEFCKMGSFKVDGLRLIGTRIERIEQIYTDFFFESSFTAPL